MTTGPTTTTDAAAPKPGGIHQYFKRLAANYPYLTGNTTQNLFIQLLKNEIQTSPHPINSESVVHDVAAGPATATSALLRVLDQDSLPREEILVSDNEDNMVAEAEKCLASWETKTCCKNLDAHDLSSLPDNHFTHVITNFSIFNLRDPVAAVREVHRTLRSGAVGGGGMAVFACWERFVVVDMVHAAQRRVRPGLNPERDLMRAAGPEFFQEGHLERVVAEGGFAPDRIASSKQEIVVGGEKELDGLRDFLLSPFTARVREGYNEADEAMFTEAIEDFIQAEKEKYGGLKFTSFGVLAVK